VIDSKLAAIFNDLDYANVMAGDDSMWPSPQLVDHAVLVV
jgi:hypothetical protein